MTSLIGLTEFIGDRVDARRPRGVDRAADTTVAIEEVWHDWLADHDYDDGRTRQRRDRLAAITAVDEIGL